MLKFHHRKARIFKKQSLVLFLGHPFGLALFKFCLSWLVTCNFVNCLLVFYVRTFRDQETDMII